jgi:hypothetical protein
METPAQTLYKTLLDMSYHFQNHCNHTNQIPEYLLFAAIIQHTSLPPSTHLIPSSYPRHHTPSSRQKKTLVSPFSSTLRRRVALILNPRILRINQPLQVPHHLALRAYHVLLRADRGLLDADCFGVRGHDVFVEVEQRRCTDILFGLGGGWKPLWRS